MAKADFFVSFSDLFYFIFYFELVLPNEHLHQGDLAYLLAYISHNPIE